MKAASNNPSLIRIGTRGSPLALAQAHEVRAKLMAAHGLPEDAFEIIVRSTSGDQIQNRPLSEVGGKGLFTKELEEGLIDGSMDLAVHSMKDVATILPPGLTITAMLEREDVRDAFLSPAASSLAELPHAAIVGTSSLRRQSQVKRLRPDVSVIMYRGNVQTRLRKLEEGVAHATLLACAGLKRMNLLHLATAVIEPDEMLPACAQGAIGIEIRADDQRTRDLVAVLDHPPTTICVSAERAFLRILDGSCKTPIAGLALLDNGALSFRGEILSPDGTQTHATSRSGTSGDAIAIGEDAARELLDRAGPDFLKA